MGFCGCINKTFLIVLNFIIFAIGAGVIVLASIVIHRSSEYGELFLSGILTLPICTLIVGIIITLLGFFGCCGAIRESKCMLLTYASVVTILFFAELTLGILVALYPEEASSQIKAGMEKTFKNYNVGDKSLSRAIDAIQHDLKCCGVEGYKDWKDDFNRSPPASCCKDITSCNAEVERDLFPRGCFEAIEEDLRSVTLALGITAVVLGIVQLVCICIACGLAQRRSQYV